METGQPVSLETLVFPDEKTLIKQEKKTLVWRVRLGGSESAVVKMYRHLGLLNRWRGRAVPFRVQREFAALGVLAAGGVPCSAPLLWGVGSAAGHGHIEVLVTREIPGAVSLKEWLDVKNRRVTSADLLPLFEVIRRAHHCGLYHGALWPKNILVTTAPSGELSFHLIDLVRSIRFPGDMGGTSVARYDLLSLLYSLARSCPDLDAEALLRGYGMSPADAWEIAGQSRRYRSTRHLRNRLAIIFKLGALAANFAARWRPKDAKS